LFDSLCRLKIFCGDLPDESRKSFPLTRLLKLATRQHMTVLFRNAATLVLTMSILLAGCKTTNPYTGEEEMTNASQKAIMGAAGGAILGAVIGNNTGDGDAGRGAIIGAAAGGLAGAGIGKYMDKQEAIIRSRLQGTGVSVTRTGNNIILNMPNDVTFETAKDEIRPQAANTLDSVAIVLREFDQTLVNVNGHADSDGDADYNYSLSTRRAAGVSRYLAGRGVNSSRLNARGFGENQPLASNSTVAGKAQNRRVEIHIVPNA
jgi:outer membrane protein OmpA-like peptidoglycan-associated protein